MPREDTAAVKPGERPAASVEPAGVPPLPPSRVLAFLGRLMLLAVLCTYFYSLRLYSAYDMGTEWVDADIGQRTAQAVRVMNGELPYRDFWAPYSPMPYFLNPAIFRVLGIRLSAFRVTLAIVGAASAFLVYLITRRIASRTAALAACLMCASWSVVSLNVNYGSWYCVPPALAAVLATLHGIDSRSRRPWVLAGLCAGLVLALKVTYGMYVICGIGVVALALRGRADQGLRRHVGTLLLAAAAGACLLLIALHNRPTVSTLLHFGLPLGLCALWAWDAGRRAPYGWPAWPRLWAIAGGIAVAFVPWIVYFGARWSVLPFLRAVFIGYAEMGASVALPPALPNPRTLGLAAMLAALLVVIRLLAGRTPRIARILAAVAGLGVFVALAVPLEGGTYADQWLFTLVRSWVHVRNFVPLVGIWIALVLLWRARKSAQGALPLFAVTACAAAIFLSYYPYSDVNHFQWAWPAQVILPCVLLDRYIRGTGRAAIPLWCIPFGIAAVQWFALSTHFVRPEVRGGPWVRRPFEIAVAPRGDVFVPATHAAVVQDAVRLIRTTTDEDAGVFELYGHHLGFLADRRNPTTFDYFWPGFLDDATQQQMIETLQQDPPAYVIGHMRTADDDPLRRFTEFFPLVGAYVQEQYRPVRVIGPYQFYAARPAAA